MQVSFSELFIILVIAVLVVKPEQLPLISRTLVRWIKTSRHALAKIKQTFSLPLDKAE